MNKRIFQPFLRTILFTIVLMATAVLSAQAAAIYGVTNSNQLVRFGATTPGTVTTIGTISGMQAGENVLGIDFRPATGQLYALGSNGRIYTVNKMTAAATFVGTLTTPLNGTNFGFDFNPVPDRIRITSDSEQNLRANPNDGTNVVDGTLAYAGGDPNSGQNPTITGSAYTNSFSGTTTTTLYNIDSNLNILVTQNPPNAGTLNTVGALGVDPTNVIGFDHTAASNIAYAAMNVGGSVGFYNINLTTGAATLIGALGNQSITDITVEIGSSPALTAYGLTNANQLVRFNTKRSNTPLGTVAITGLNGGENMRGIDFRPATGQLFGVSDANRLFIINQFTGAATLVGTLSNGVTFPNVGFDFNPTVDRIRIVSEADENRRANPNDATAIIDGTLAFAAGDVNAGQNPNVVAAGYTNSFGGATTTALFDIDSNLDILAQQNPANAGTLTTIGGLTWNTSANAGLDIFSGNNTALASLELVIGGNPAGNSGLYQVDLTTGTAAFIAPIGVAAPIISLAVGNNSAASRVLDFEGDGKTDFTTFRLNENRWYIDRSSGGSFFHVQWGLAQSDFLTPADFDGDGRTDVAVWRPTDGVWYVLRSSDLTAQFYQFGTNGDEPVARDYDGDGKADFAIARRTGGQIVWYIANSSNASIRIETFGLDGDYVAPGDYDGDGRFDLGAYRDGEGVYYVQRSRDGFLAVQFGSSGDLIVPGDYDGDGKTDLAAVTQGTQYVWKVLRSSDGGMTTVAFGQKPDFTTQGDYDGDGKTDIAVWRPSIGDYFVLRSTTGTAVQTHFGLSGDYPVANFDTH